LLYSSPLQYTAPYSSVGFDDNVQEFPSVPNDNLICDASKFTEYKGDWSFGTDGNSCTLSSNPTDEYGAVYCKGEEYSKYADYTITTSVSVHQLNSFGVYFRIKSLSEHSKIFYVANFAKDKITVAKHSNGQEVLGHSTDGLTEGGSYQIKVEVKGDTFTVSVNGEAKVVATDNTLKLGSFGFKS
jgi:hypothetical protein